MSKQNQQKLDLFLHKSTEKRNVELEVHNDLELNEFDNDFYVEHFSDGEDVIPDDGERFNDKFQQVFMCHFLRFYKNKF